jgi:hypothetical protein
MTCNRMLRYRIRILTLTDLMSLHDISVYVLLLTVVMKMQTLRSIEIKHIFLLSDHFNHFRDTGQLDMPGILVLKLSQQNRSLRS